MKCICVDNRTVPNIIYYNDKGKSIDHQSSVIDALSVQFTASLSDMWHPTRQIQVIGFVLFPHIEHSSHIYIQW